MGRKTNQLEDTTHQLVRFHSGQGQYILTVGEHALPMGSAAWNTVKTIADVVEQGNETMRQLQALEALRDIDQHGKL